MVFQKVNDPKAQIRINTVNYNLVLLSLREDLHSDQLFWLVV